MKGACLHHYNPLKQLVFICRHTNMAKPSASWNLPFVLEGTERSFQKVAPFHANTPGEA